MKKVYYLLMMAMIAALTACEKDNYDAPDGGVSGNIIDAKTNEPVPLPVEGSTGTMIRLMEVGTKATKPIGFYAKQDGSFANTKVFNCEYTVTATGPFQIVESPNVIVKGQTKTDIKVTPYSRITASCNANGELVSIQYTVETSDPSYMLTEVYAYWDYQKLVDDVSSHYSKKLSKDGQGNETGTFEFDLSTDDKYQANKYKIESNGGKVYFRVGAQTNGHVNYSKVIEVKL